MNSFVFFGGIIAAVGLVSAAALALCGPENEVEKRATKTASSASYGPIDSAAVVASVELPAVPTVLPEMVPPEAPPVEAPAPKGKKRGGRGGKKR